MSNQGAIWTQPIVAHFFQPIDGRRHPDNLELILRVNRCRCSRPQPVNHKAKLLASWRTMEKVNFVHNDGADTCKRLRARQLQRVKRLWRDNEAE